MQKKNDFQTTILHSESSLNRQETYRHYCKEWERLNRLAKLAQAANEDETTIDNLYGLMEKVTTLMVKNLD